MSAAQALYATPEEFEAASSWLIAIPAAAHLCNDTKLELYGLFKYNSTAAGPTQPRPSIFSPTPRAKFDAWATCTARYDALQDGRGRARGRYVEITRNIGWTGEGLDEEDEDVDLDDVVDESTQVNQGQGRRKAPAGMGPRMSMMIHEDGVGDPGKSSPIHEAIIDGSEERVRDLLLQDPSCVNVKDEYGYTPLHLAADRGHTNLVKLLLGVGADREVEDVDGQTPFMLAEISGRVDVVDSLR